MIAQITNFASGWTSGLNRLAIGALALIWLGYIGLAPSFVQNLDFVSNSEVRIGAIAGLLMFILVGLLLGAMIIPLGRNGIGSEVLSEKSRMSRIKLVGSSQNPLLIEACRDAHERADVVTGVMGLLFFCTIAFFLKIIEAALEGNIEFLTASESTDSNVHVLPWLVGAIAFSWWMRRTVCESLNEIDALFLSADSSGKTQ